MDVIEMIVFPVLITRCTPANKGCTKIIILQQLLSPSPHNLVLVFA